MPLNSIEEGVVHNGGRGVPCKCVVDNGSNPTFFGSSFTFRGPAFFLPVHFFYACVYFITREDTDMN